jgi:hypothetical protein
MLIARPPAEPYQYGTTPVKNLLALNQRVQKKTNSHQSHCTTDVKLLQTQAYSELPWRVQQKWLAMLENTLSTLITYIHTTHTLSLKG